MATAQDALQAPWVKTQDGHLDHPHHQEVEGGDGNAGDIIINYHKLLLDEDHSWICSW